MSSRKTYILFLVNLTAFIILETISLTMVSHNSIVQHSEMMSRISAAVNTVTGATGNVLRYFSLGKVNRRLAEENVSLRTENDRLREALARMEIPDTLYRDSSLFRYIPAAVVSNSTDRTHNVIIINRGRRDGVTEDMGVITDRGIIGYVESAGEKYSKVSSLLDTDNMASAVLRSSGTFGDIPVRHTGGYCHGQGSTRWSQLRTDCHHVRGFFQTEARLCRCQKGHR